MCTKEKFKRNKIYKNNYKQFRPIQNNSKKNAKALKLPYYICRLVQFICSFLEVFRLGGV